MNEHIDEDRSRMRENIMDDFPEQPETVMSLESAISIILQTASSGCSVAELMDNAARLAMEYHDADSAFYFHYDKGMKTARCINEIHRENFDPICGTEPLYMDEYPKIMQMMVDIVLTLAAKKEFVNFPDLLSLLPKGSREAKRIEQIGLRGVIGAAYNDGRDFIVVANPRANISEHELLRLLTYVLTMEISKQGNVDAQDAFSFGKGRLAKNEVYVGLLGGFELRTIYGTITEETLTSGRVISFLTLLLFQEDHKLSKDTIMNKIWGEDNQLSHKIRTLNDVGYKAVSSIHDLFPSDDFLEKDKYIYNISRSYKIITELDVMSYEIRDIEGLRDEEMQLKRYLELLDRFSVMVLPRQAHTGIEHIVHRYDEKKKELQIKVLELMWQLEKYDEMHSFATSFSVALGAYAELVYWDIKALTALDKHSSARELFQSNRELFSARQQHELADYLGVEGF